MDDKTWEEVSSHYKMWTDDMQIRITRKNGFNDIIDAYYGKLPDDWPYISRVVDPCIRTSLIEKNGRILNSKLKGRLVPREGGDTVGALLNNAVLDYQWDNANEGGSMMIKLENADMNTRLVGSTYADVFWKYELDDDGKCVFDGNEIKILDTRNCGMDPSASHVRDARWFQIETWEKLEDLENAKDGEGKPLYKNLDKIKVAIAEKLGKKSSKNNRFTPRVKQLRSLQDRTGEDMAYPVVKIVQERRKDKVIIFSPEHHEILLETDNPYLHGKINIAQLRYYPIQDEAIGESEVESVLGLWRAIQATLCSFLDEMILKMRPPLKIVENAARIETIQRGPDAQWLVDRQDAIEEMPSNGEALQYFQVTYQALKTAFNTSMGDISQGISNLDLTKPDKTATEVRQSATQQNSRDQKNQNDFGEFITDIMMMWLSNNKQFLFSNAKKSEYLVRIVGKDKFAKLQQIGLDQSTVLPETMQMIGDIVNQHPEIGNAQLMQLYEAGKIPTYPIVLNPNEKDPEKIQMKPKMTVSEQGDIADVTLVPEDLDGTYDYVPDVKSMSIGASDLLMQSRQRALDRLTTNPTVLQLLQSEGYTVNIRELMVDDFEDQGLDDAEKYFTKVGPPEAGGPQMGGAPSPLQFGGVPGAPQADLGGGIPQQMVGPQPIEQGGPAPIPNPGIVPQGL